MCLVVSGWLASLSILSIQRNVSVFSGGLLISSSMSSVDGIQSSFSFLLVTYSDWFSWKCVVVAAAEASIIVAVTVVLDIVAPVVVVVAVNGT